MSGETDRGKTVDYEALVLDAREGVFTLSVALEREVVNVSYTPKDAVERAMLEVSFRLAIPVRVDIAGHSLVVAVRRG